MTVEDTPDGFPGAEYLENTNWKFISSFSDHVKDYLWHPVKNELITD